MLDKTSKMPDAEITYRIGGVDFEATGLGAKSEAERAQIARLRAISPAETNTINGYYASIGAVRPVISFNAEQLAGMEDPGQDSFNRAFDGIQGKLTGAGQKLYQAARSLNLALG